MTPSVDESPTAGTPSPALRLISWVARNIVALTVVGLSLYAVVEAQQWRFQVRLAPQVTAATVAVLGSVALLRDTMAGARREHEARSPRRAAREFVARQKGMLWFIAVIAIVLVLGLQMGLPVAIILVTKVALDAKWSTTALLVVAASSVLLLFDTFFRIFWFEGWLFRLIPG